MQGPCTRFAVRGGCDLQDVTEESRRWILIGIAGPCACLMICSLKCRVFLNRLALMGVIYEKWTALDLYIGWIRQTFMLPKMQGRKGEKSACCPVTFLGHFWCWNEYFLEISCNWKPAFAFSYSRLIHPACSYCWWKRRAWLSMGFIVARCYAMYWLMMQNSHTSYLSAWIE